MNTLYKKYAGFLMECEEFRYISIIILVKYNGNLYFS